MPLWLQKIKWWYEDKKAGIPPRVLLVLVFLWNVFTRVPDLFDAVKFWVESVKTMAGVIGWVATIVNSPWFSIGLILIGFVWLRFVGKSRRQLRHPIWPVLGWTLVSLVSLAFWSVLVAGYAISRVSGDFRQKVEILQRQMIPRQIVKRSEFVKALREAGPTILNVNYIAGDEEAANLFADLHGLLLAGGWVIKETGSIVGVSWRGVKVAVRDRSAPPPGARLMIELLKQNGIAADLSETPAFTLDTFSVDIGYKPRS